MKLVIGIESTAHTFGVGLASIDGKIIEDFSDQYKPEKGGIHPREASEHHVKVADILIAKAFERVKELNGEIVAIGFSRGPGLGPCLRIGATVARALAYYLNVPLYGVHHGIAHIEIGKKLTGGKDPLTILVSGGHTMIVALQGSRYRIFGETLDISLGNLIDMFMREAGYPSPAGPLCEKFASETDEFIELPYIVKGTDLSYSGLFTMAVKKYKELISRGVEKNKAIRILCRSLQEIAFSMLVEVSERALAHTKKKEIMIVGGVSANKRLQNMLRYIANEHGAKLLIPNKWHGDNGAMIAWTTVLHYKYDKPLEIEKSGVIPLWRLDEVYIPWG